jgi:crotonobetainyl-CoA:carnitine CoA-transferase CaiB-like acyl-CoA transferase
MADTINSIYQSLLSHLNINWPTTADVALSGSDPVVDSVFRIGECAAAVLGAQGAGVAEIWRRRTGRRQQISIDALAGALASFSVGYQSQHGYAIPQPEPSYPLVELYPVRNGRWFMLHGAYPLLRNGLLDLLGCTMNPSDIASKAAAWDAFALEEAVAAKGLCGAAVRSREEWLDTEQGRAVAATPLIEIIKIGESKPEPFAPAKEGDRPLTGIKVLDLTHVIAGPTLGKSLAEQGAEIMHITDPTQPSLLPFVVDTGHGKLQALLTLTEDADAATLRELIAQSDIFVESYRPGAISKLGFSPEAVAEMRPGSIYVSVNCYGWAGPWLHRPGWEQLAQVVTGMTVAQGTPDQPLLQPVYPNDYVAGFLGALGALMALLRREKEGGSYHVRISLCRTAMWIQSQGQISKSQLPPPVIPHAEVHEYLCTQANPAYGPLTFLGPVLRYSETPARWERPSLPLGAHLPVWPSRAVSTGERLQHTQSRHRIPAHRHP